MPSEARVLLDEQIAALNKLRKVAESACLKMAMLPSMAQRSRPSELATYLATLAVDRRQELNDCLDVAKHWLGPTNPVQVPTLIAEADLEFQSACEGTNNLLLQVAVMIGITAGTAESLSNSSSKLAKSLAARFRREGIPDWLQSAPVHELQSLADAVGKETDAAIARLKNDFLAFSATASLDAERVKTPTKRLGRRKADCDTEVREAKIAKDWMQARAAGVYKGHFAKDKKMTQKELQKILDRVAKRNSRSEE